MSLKKEEDMQSTIKDSKKKKYLQCYKKEWEFEFPDWLQESYKGPNYAYCKSCDKNIKITSGKDSLRKHNKARAHMESSENIKSQQKISFTSTKIQKKDLQVKKGPSKRKLESLLDLENDIESESPEGFSTAKSPKLIQISCEAFPNLSENLEVKNSATYFKRERLSPSKRTRSRPKVIILNNTGSQKISSKIEGPTCSNETIVENISHIFKEDLLHFLNKNEPVSKFIQSNSDFTSGKEGFSRLTRMLVSQMANQYFMDYSVDSFRSNVNPNKSNLMARKLNEIEKTMEQSVLEVKTIKAQFDHQGWPHQPKILIDSLSSVCQDEFDHSD